MAASGFGRAPCVAYERSVLPERDREMIFTIEFFRIRKQDDAHAMLDRVTHIAADLENTKVKARSLFDTLNMPQTPDGLRILDQDGNEVFFWIPGDDDS
jgi:hypothetical protein